MSEDWKQKRAEGLAEKTAAAQGLVGATIADAVVKPHDENCDGQNVLELTMTDGSVWLVVGGYRGYTGHSCDEYPEDIVVRSAGSA